MSKIISIWEANKDDNFFDNLESKQKSLGDLFEDPLPDSENQTLKYPPAKLINASEGSSPSSAPDGVPSNGGSANSVNPTPKVTWVTQIAKVVNSYKDGKLIGKVGVALLKNTCGYCKIVVYRTKTKMLATFSVNLNEESCQLHRQSTYLQFYDDNSAYWSILFDNEFDEHAFIRKLHENGIKIRQEAGDFVEPQRQQTMQLPHWKKAPDEDIGELKKESKNKYQSVVDSLQMQLSKYDDGIESADSTLVTKVKSRNPSTTTIMPAGMKTQMLNNTNMALYGIDNSPIANSTMESQFLQMLMSENRTHNAELRMNMSKLENKMEKVVESVSAMSSGTTRHDKKDNDMFEMEEQMLALKKENRKLKLEIEDRVQETKVADLERALKYHKDDLDMMGLINVGDVDALVGGLIEKATKYLSDLAKSEVYKNEYYEELQQTQNRLVKEAEQHNQAKKTLEELENANKTLVITLEENNKMKFELQQNYDKLSKNYIDCNRQHKLQTEATIKTIMNNLYGNLATKIERLHKLNKNEILGIIGRTIRDETLEAVEQIKQ